MPDEKARRHLSGMDLKISCPGLVTFRKRMREKHMLRHSAFRFAHHLPLLTENGAEMTARATEWRKNLLEGSQVPVI